MYKTLKNWKSGKIYKHTITKIHSWPLNIWKDAQIHLQWEKCKLQITEILFRIYQIDENWQVPLTTRTFYVCLQYTSTLFFHGVLRDWGASPTIGKQSDFCCFSAWGSDVLTHGSAWEPLEELFKLLRWGYFHHLGCWRPS